MEKGSITVDGVSLTVASRRRRRFSVSLIPTTLALTTLGHKGVGDVVNLEVDVIAKYVERLLAHGQDAAGGCQRMSDRLADDRGGPGGAPRTGRPVLVLDDEERENEGDLVLAAETATEEWMAWTDPPLVRLPLRADAGRAWPTGSSCRSWSPTTATRCAPPTRCRSTRPAGVTTGISAADRPAHRAGARRPCVGARPTSSAPVTCCRCGPGHGGVLTRPGHTEAAVDLTRLAGLPPVGVIGELVHDDGRMMRYDAVVALGA